MSPTGPPVDGWRGWRGWSGRCVPVPINVSPPRGVCPHTWPCSAGPSPAALSGPYCTPAAVGELTHGEAQAWGYVLWCPVWNQTQFPEHSFSDPRDTMDWGKSWRRRPKTPPGLWLGLYCRQEAAGSHPAAICFHLPLLSSASRVSPLPHRHLATSVSPSHQSWLEVGVAMGSIFPSPQQAAFIPGWLPSPPPLPARAPQGWQENNSEEDE